MWNLLVVDARLATMDGDGRVLEGAAVAVSGEHIAWVGPGSELPTARARHTLDVEGALVTPGLVDCHTHLVFAGDRLDEFERRLGGAGYAELAAGGGGINSTVTATRAATDDALLASAARRLRTLADGGVTTVEVKSGYGLDLETELRLLRVARRLDQEVDVDVHVTFLGAHAVPSELRGRPDAYVESVCEEMLPVVAREHLADSVDVFCESIAFDVPQAERVLRRARELGLPVRVHADQLSDSGGADLAARSGALSADHLEHTPPAALKAMAAAGVVGVVLPGASLVVDDPATPDIEAMRAAGLRVAVATDANPGTSPLLSLPLAMTLACTRFGLTPTEALLGTTAHAAAALGRTDTGVVAVGRCADLAVWEATRPGELVYWMGADLCRTTIHRGRLRR